MSSRSRRAPAGSGPGIRTPPPPARAAAAAIIAGGEPWLPHGLRPAGNYEPHPYHPTVQPP